MSGLINKIMFERIKKFIRKETHKCIPIQYPDTEEDIIFHWDVPWLFSQEFTVCQECNKVKVISEIKGDNRSPLGGYRREVDGTTWSGKCDFAKVPSIGRDKLVFSKNSR